jgi:hypothetical protein
VLAGGLQRLREAQAAFEAALREDASASLFGDFITNDVQKAWNDAHARASPSGGSSQQKSAELPRTSKGFRGDRAPRGWRSAEAYFFFTEAGAAEAERTWAECAGNAQASLALENRVQTRFLAASCEERAGLWLEALGDYRIVAETGGRAGRNDLARSAKERVAEIEQKIPKIVLRKPARASDLAVKMNGVPVPDEQLGGEIWVNPGERAIAATGKIDGASLVFEDVVTVPEGRTVTVEIKLVPRSVVDQDKATIKCLSGAKTREEMAKCVGGGSLTTGLDLRIGTELSGYHDSEHVDVVTPAIFVSAESPTAGWGVGASLLVDVVTAASSDIVSTASPRWTEVRYVPALRGHKKLGEVDASLKANLSVEPDYLATSVGAGASMDLAQKTITPSIGYELSYDVSGRAGTSFDAFSRTISRHGLDLACTFVLDKATFLGLSGTAVLESGDGSKPYRYVPLFAPDVAARVQPGQSIESVNLARTPDRALEQLPLDRQRWALSGRVAHRFSSTTLRAEERLYVDSWGLKATTTDASYFVDLTNRVRVWPHLRFHAQSGADFWRLAYASKLTPSGDGSVPALRTGDRELGPLWNLTLGAGTALTFGEKNDISLSVTGDFVYSRFLEHLFILQRFAYFGATTLEVELE